MEHSYFRVVKQCSVENFSPLCLQSPALISESQHYFKRNGGGGCTYSTAKEDNLNPPRLQNTSKKDLQLPSKCSKQGLLNKWSTLLSSELWKKSIRQSCILKTLEIEQSFCGCESHFPHRLNSELQPTAKIREIESNFIHIWSSNGRSLLPNSMLGITNPACVPWKPQVCATLLNLWRAGCLNWVCDSHSQRQAC